MLTLTSGRYVLALIVCYWVVAAALPVSHYSAGTHSNNKAAPASTNLTRFVNPFIGTAGHGHTFPGASLPFGMVQLSPDTRLTGWDGCSGYHYSDKQIYGFSHTHLSGTGISDYGDILFMPALNEPSLSPDINGAPTAFKHKDETASPGYYSVRLANEILVELTATQRAGFHRYTFPAGSSSAYVVLDLKHRDRVLDSQLKIVDPTHLEGFRRSTAWAKNQIVYFYAEFSKPFESFTTPDNQREQRGTSVKASFRFGIRSREPLLLKVGISAVSIEGARKNLKTEIDGWDFEQIRKSADSIWNKELNKIQVSGGNERQLETFYTALYHAELAPNLFMDVDGQYLGRDFNIHQANGFENYTVFSLWDTFRAAHPLYTIIDQNRTADFINTFLTQYRQGGRLPVWELAANETDTMIGYHAVSVIADALTKGIGGFDREMAFAAMKHSAELKHYGLDSYMAHGYIASEDERESVSKTLEYAYDDWCIAIVARVLGHMDDYQRYSRRAQSYKNVFDRNTGFVRPRTNGGWLTPFDPRQVDFNFTEANGWQYTFFAPQDIRGLIELMGGEKNFARKLDDLFSTDSKTTGREQADITGLIGQYAHGNEPSHHVAYLYDYVREPWKTQYRVRQIMDRFYKPEPDGLIGNEDCGQMSAWYVFSAVGFYPVTPGAKVYAIGTPLFPEVRFNFESGRSFVIKAEGVSESNFYIQSARLNGRKLGQPFLSHEDLMAGGELTFEMGARPNLRWSTSDSAWASEITTESIVPVPVVNAADKTFQASLEVSLEANGNNQIVHFTTDGSEPTAVSRVFQRPLHIEDSTTVKAIAIDRRGQTSQVVTARFLKIPHDWRLSLRSKYSSQYAAGGDLALIDGLRGTTNFSGGAWQGYQGKDLEATIDLGRVQSISKLGAGFLQDVGSWILMPTQIEFAISRDGSAFETVLSIKNEVPADDFQTITKDFIGAVEGRAARYVRMRAKNFGKLPAWHPGAGGDAWIFCDEILIQ